MANLDHLAVLRKGVDAWNKWRGNNTEIKVDFREAALGVIDLTDANLVGVDFCEADLRSAKFGNCNLARSNLRRTVLHDCDLSSVAGLQPEQFAGADLARAKLPEPLENLFGDLDAVHGISENAQKLFVATLAACLYSWLTIATTTDVGLVTNRASSPLPIIQTSIPIVGFYLVTPLLLVGVYFYFHFYLQKLWEELGSLPAIFPDGRPLQAKADPWLLSDLVRSHVVKLSANRPFLSYLQKWISILLAWWLVPITVALFWVRFLPRHDLAGTVFHCLLTATCITAAGFLYQLTGKTLRGEERNPFAWKSALRHVRAYQPLIVALASTVVLCTISIGAVQGVRSGRSDRDWWPKSHGPRSWIPNAFTFIGYSPFADLRAADLSLKPPNWTGKGGDAELDAVKGLQLRGVDLRYADLRAAFAVATVLADAHLEGAELLLADLRRSELAGAHLEGADLLGAHLERADMIGADLRGADLTNADLTQADIKYADFTGVNTVTVDQLKKANNWSDAFYDPAFLQALNLSLDNNEAVRQHLKADEESTRGNPAAARLGQLPTLIPGSATEVSTIRALLIKNVDAKTVETVSVNSAGSGSKGSPFSVMELARLYDFPTAFDGRGQTIGILEFGGGYRESDLNRYFADAGIPKPTVSSVSVDGQTNRPDSDDGAISQVELDIEVVGAVAPGSHLVVYFSPNTDRGYVDAINSVVQDRVHKPSVLIIDWGSSEKNRTSDAIQTMNEALHRAAMSGITVAVPSGEDGARDGIKDGQAHVNFPASSPWVLAVGGTRLTASGNSIVSEVAWNDLGAGATGGGVSDIFAQPEWQSASNVPRREGRQRGRGVPDVAANASPLTGYKVFIDGKYNIIGGTSAATPLWAGLIALINQAIGRNIGFINPILYKEIGPRKVLNAITSGDNSIEGVKGYRAGPGWNACTGWGTPSGKKLLEALRAAGNPGETAVLPTQGLH